LGSTAREIVSGIGASHPVSDESGALPQKYTFLKQPIGRTDGIEF